MTAILCARCSALVGPCARQLVVVDEFAAAVASLLFAVHPVHVEAVASIVGRAELLCCWFMLLSLLSYDKAARPMAFPATTLGALHRTLWFTLSILLAVCATASKETGLTCLGIAAALDVINFMRSAARGMMRTRAVCLLRCMASVLVTALLFVISRQLRGAQLSPYFSRVDNPLPSLPDVPSRAWSIAHTHVRYGPYSSPGIE